MHQSFDSQVVGSSFRDERGLSKELPRCGCCLPLLAIVTKAVKPDNTAGGKTSTAQIEAKAMYTGHQEIWDSKVKAFAKAKECLWWNWDKGPAIIYWRWPKFYQEHTGVEKGSELNLPGSRGYDTKLLWVLKLCKDDQKSSAL
eukprot:jgi/Psemu1/48166/gm1.48166_g